MGLDMGQDSKPREGEKYGGVLKEKTVLYREKSCAAGF